DAIGERGALAAAVIAATVELQGAALAIGQLASGGRLAENEARWGIVLLLVSSATVKSVLAFVSGGRAYGTRVTLGLAAMVAAAAGVAWVL
ncbi:MAG: rane protein, partial [Geminicoccaceae bacterium]|nr:rane protein [Geminicoccaceae bacterium]